jgi:hypothetical protein
VNALRRSGLLSRGVRTRWAWRYSDGHTAAITVRGVSRNEIELIYILGSERLRYPVAITWTRCNYGGERPWFRCPGRGCGRRSGKLYGGRLFLCRNCHGLAYASQREDRFEREVSKREAIRKRLGAAPGKPFFPRRPKGMHASTFERLLEEEIEAEMRVEDCLDALFRRDVPEMSTTYGTFENDGA